MKFTKMHGCGNDYVYVNCFEEIIRNPAAVSVYVSDRHFGIGSDGMILICPSEVADFRMAMYNADGSEGSMCGNGIRCVAKYVYDRGMTDRTQISVETKSGIKNLNLTVENGKVSLVKVNMGAPGLAPEQIPVRAAGDRVVDAPITVLGEEYRMTCVSMGNPHAVVFIDDTEHFPLEKVGPCFENHECFPDRVNTEFVQIISRSEANMRVWERGSGETWACGTGTCASVVACVLNGRTDDNVLVHLRGGDLEVFYDREADTVWMTGPATTVFEGEIDVSEVDRLK
ncbi:MAG: diaminopimelate epimerase [Clostridiales bacterium]|nr:diaminopimelate epimerase [Clostridiales bacterium]